MFYFAGDSILDNRCGEESIENHLEEITETRVHNCAVFGSGFGTRSKKMLDKDYYVRDNITTKDILVISIGGMDIKSITLALKFSKMIGSDQLNPEKFQEILSVFNKTTMLYIRWLTKFKVPKKIVVLGLPYPCVIGKGVNILKFLGYKENPEKIHKVIDFIYEHGTVDLKNVIHMKTSSVLDFENTEDYIDQTIPSAIGGEKIAQVIADLTKTNKT